MIWVALYATVVVVVAVVIGVKQGREVDWTDGFFCGLITILTGAILAGVIALVVWLWSAALT